MPVKISKLNKSFGDNHVLRNLELELEDGGIYCLMGPSGMGKTTLLRIILGLERMDFGTIYGIAPDKTTAMFQEDRLCPALSAIENVALICKKKPSRGDIRKSLEEILPSECLDQPISELSGGMKRRVALARAFYEPGGLVVLDEPFTGLDTETKKDVIEYLLKQRKGRILLVATHGEDDAALLGASVIRLEEIQEGRRSHG